MSPVTDVTVSGASYVTKANADDPTMTAESIRIKVADYLGDADPEDGLLSPRYADLTGLTPLLIQAGSSEVLLDDAIRLAAAPRPTTSR